MFENFEKEKAHKIQLVEENVEDWCDAYRAQVDMLTAKIASLESSIKPEESFRIMIAELGETINRFQAKRCDTCGGPSAASEVDKHKEVAYKLRRELDQNHNYILELASQKETLRALSSK